MLNTTNEISKQAIMDQEDAIKKCMDDNKKRVLILGIAGSGKSFVDLETS